MGVYPSVTFPSHTTLVTGVLPAVHGIVNNRVFVPPTDDEFAALSQFELTDLEPLGLTGDELLSEALAGLARCKAVGVTSDMDRSFALFSAAIGRRVESVEARLNASPVPSEVANLDPGLRHRLEELNTVDLELFHMAEDAIAGST